MKQKLFEFITLCLDNFTQKKNIAVIKKILGNEINTFFDVGAHKCETINLFNKHFKIKKIFAFEANVDLISNYKAISNTTIISKGIGEKNGKKKFYKNNFSAISSFNCLNEKSNYSKLKKKITGFVYSKKETIVEKEVNIITLESFCKKNKISKIELLKIDTEGYEFSVLKGLKNNLTKVDVILFEHHYDSSLIKNYKFSDIHNLLIKNNFERTFKNKMIFRKIFEYIYVNKNQDKENYN
jgi:FkbM family methyltransferase